VILLEEEYGEESDLISLGTVAMIRDRFNRLSFDPSYVLWEYGPHWLIVEFGNGSLAVDLHNGETEERDTVTLFVEAKRPDNLIPDLLHRLIEDNQWTLYEYGTQKITRPTAYSDPGVNFADAVE